jgi:Tol biopolymer transport system component
MLAHVQVRRVPAAFLGLALALGGLVLAAPARAVTPGVDGEIAYVQRANGSRSDLFAMNANGSNKGRLTTTRRVGEGTPAWSPRGGQLAFQAVRNGVRRIFVLNVSTGVVRRVSDGPFSDRFPAWSPNSRRIAYRSLRRLASGGDLGSAHIYTVPSTGGARVQLTEGTGINTDPAWSPDGTRIAFASNRDGNYDIYVMDADGSDVVQLTTDGVGPPVVNNRYPTWSPDGTSIAYASNRLERDEEIYVLDPDAPADPDVRLTDNPGLDRWPAWSPGGSRIAFASNRDGTFDIFTMNAVDGSGVTRLTSGTARRTEPSWQSIPGCTIVGTNGSNQITGTPGADVICALGGGDTIDGRGGADLIYGGPGTDVIRGGLGNDTIFAGRGNDTIFGGSGRDRLFGEYGRDTLFARDRQRDRLDGGPARDRARIDPRLDRRQRIEVLF